MHYYTRNNSVQLNIPAKAGIQTFYNWIPCQARNVKVLNACMWDNCI